MINTTDIAKLGMGVGGGGGGKWEASLINQIRGGGSALGKRTGITVNWEKLVWVVFFSP